MLVDPSNDVTNIVDPSGLIRTHWLFQFFHGRSAGLFSFTGQNYYLLQLVTLPVQSSQTLFDFFF